MYETLENHVTGLRIDKSNWYKGKDPGQQQVDMFDIEDDPFVGAVLDRL
jgi:hypothetical protein